MQFPAKSFENHDYKILWWILSSSWFITPTNLIKNLRDDGKAPSSYIADITTANAQVRSLSETIRLDSRTKLLNPKWYEGMLKSGYEGVREVSNRLNYTLGWSATSGQVDNFVYEESNERYEY